MIAKAKHIEYLARERQGTPDDYMDVGGRATQEAKAEEVIP